MEEIVLNIIMHSGKARGYSMDAITAAKAGYFNEARELIAKADEELGYAHGSQASLIQGEAVNDKIEFSLLLVHAEDHLMTSITFRDLSIELIEIHEKINSMN